MAETVLYNESPAVDAIVSVFDKKGFAGAFNLGMNTMIGRKTDKSSVDIKLNSPIVSRMHGQIAPKDGGFAYVDKQSTNGTYLNDEYIGKNSKSGKMYSMLNNGDRIIIDIWKDNSHNPDMVMMLFSTTVSADSWKKQPLDTSIAEMCIGRSVQNGIRVQNPMISEKHASFFNTQNGWAVIDHGSTNGVYINGKRMTVPKYIEPFDVIRIADLFFVFTGNELYYTDYTLNSGEEITRVLHPGTQTEESVRKEQPVEPVGQEPPVQPAQSVQPIPPAQPAQPAQPRRSVNNSSSDLVINIVARNVVQRFKQLTLLQDINISIGSGEMVLILGGSGAGKTTFMNAVMGYEKAEGRILYKNTDIYQEYERMKYEIGFVPQQDLIRDKDTVYDTLDNAAEMRLPRSMSKEMRHEKLDKVLDQMGLSREKYSLVSKLSGGQKKRLSIAVELISDPSLFFLDEPDSGLDDVMGRGLMATLRGIADTGKIVMIITHSPERALDYFDKVIVLAKSAVDNSGHLAFYGPVDEAFKFFGAERFRDIVQKINRPDENGEGLSDYYIEKYKNYTR